jgi:hypothetical protein
MQHSQAEGNAIGRVTPCGPRALEGASKTNLPEHGVAQTTSVVERRNGTGGGETGGVDRQPHTQRADDVPAWLSARWQQLRRRGRTFSELRRVQQHTCAADRPAAFISRAVQSQRVPTAGWVVPAQTANQQRRFGNRFGRIMNGVLQGASISPRIVGMIA